MNAPEMLTIEIPGGCLDCHAIQRLDISTPPLIFLEIMHDDTCPSFAALERDA